MRICIDAGHGGSDPGAVAQSGEVEKQIALQYALTLKDLLAGDNEILMTRVNDDFVGLSLRAQKANGWKADCFISLHANAALRKAANGAWVIHDDDTVHGITLAQLVWREMAKIPSVVDADPAEEVYPDNSPWVGNRELAVVSNTHMPAILVELGFLTNEDDLADLTNPDMRLRICRAIAIGIHKWAVERGFRANVDLVNDDPITDVGTEDPKIVPITGWNRPARLTVQEEAHPEEPMASVAVRTIKGMVESKEAQEVLSSFKLRLMKLLLEWLENLVEKLLGLD